MNDSDINTIVERIAFDVTAEKVRLGHLTFSLWDILLGLTSSAVNLLTVCPRPIAWKPMRRHCLFDLFGSCHPPSAKCPLKIGLGYTWDRPQTYNHICRRQIYQTSIVHLTLPFDKVTFAQLGAAFNSILFTIQLFTKEQHYFSCSLKCNLKNSWLVSFALFLWLIDNNFLHLKYCQ